MNSRLIELAERREQLVARIALQRIELSGHLAPWKGVCAVADKGMDAVRFVRRHPAWMAGAAAFVLALRPRKALAWMRRGWTAWKLIRNLRQRLAGE